MNEGKEMIVTLDNNKDYSVVSSISFNGKKYISLINLEDCADCIIGEIQDDEITVVSDTELLNQLIVEFSKAC